MRARLFSGHVRRHLFNRATKHFRSEPNRTRLAGELYAPALARRAVASFYDFEGSEPLDSARTGCVFPRNGVRKILRQRAKWRQQVSRIELTQDFVPRE